MGGECNVNSNKTMTPITPIGHYLNYSPLDNVDSSSVIKPLATDLESEIIVVHCKHSPKNMISNLCAHYILYGLYIIIYFDKNTYSLHT